jgi:hypothetical protein
MLSAKYKLWRNAAGMITTFLLAPLTHAATAVADDGKAAAQWLGQTAFKDFRYGPEGRLDILS